MPCKDALIAKVKALSPDTTVEKALAALKKEKTHIAPVVDGDGVFMGMFGIAHLLEDLLPVSLDLDSTSLGNIRIPAAPGMSKRLQVKKSVSIDKIMKHDCETVGTEDSIEKAVNILRRTSGQPIPVLDDKGQFAGLITAESLLSHLDK